VLEVLKPFFKFNYQHTNEVSNQVSHQSMEVLVRALERPYLA
jgi:hypothetical protein